MPLAEFLLMGTSIFAYHYFCTISANVNTAEMVDDILVLLYKLF